MSRNLLAEGLSDAVGFVGGALLGFWAGSLLGWNIFAAGYGIDSIGGILLVGLGGGLGLQLARRWQAAQAAQSKSDDGTDDNSSKDQR
jgi:predicted lipid-binding transport protein (Tim44 family)